MKYMCGSCCMPAKFRVGIGKLLNFVITFNKENSDKIRKSVHFKYFFSEDHFNV